jgi:hypothetical protein
MSDVVAVNFALGLLDGWLAEVLDDPAFELGDNAEEWPKVEAFCQMLKVDPVERLRHVATTTEGTHWDGLMLRHLERTLEFLSSQGVEIKTMPTEAA